MKKTLLFICSVVVSAALFSANVTAVADGLWTDDDIWSTGNSPANNDIVTIPSGFEVEIDINTPEYTNMTVNVYGDLTIDNGAKLDMDANGVVNIHTGGQLHGVNGGSKIRIGGNTVFTGPGTVNGPSMFNVSGQGPLPIQLIAFSAKQQENQIVLSWSTATEVSNDFFTIERSSDGYTFEIIGKVKGNGNSSTALNYSFTDVRPLDGTSYYRLKQTDYDGRSEYFNIVPVTIGKNISFNVYPNPATSLNTNIAFHSNFEGNVFVTVSDITGKQVYSKTAVVSEGSNVINVESSDLSKGTYIVTLNNGTAVNHQRLIVE